MIVASISVTATPSVQGNHRVGRHGRIYDSSRGLRDWRELLAWSARASMRRRTPASGPISLTLEFRLARPKRGAADLPITRPDLDKLARAVGDSLTGIVYVDDAQIVELHVSKRYATMLPDGRECLPGCQITAVELEQVSA